MCASGAQLACPTRVIDVMYNINIAKTFAGNSAHIQCMMDTFRQPVKFCIFLSQSNRIVKCLADLLFYGFSLHDQTDSW